MTFDLPSAIAGSIASGVGFWLAFHLLRRPPAGPAWLSPLAEQLNRKLDDMSAVIDRLTASVTNLTTVDASLVALTGKLAQEIRDNASDPAALNALADSLDAEAANVSAAVTANTDPAPPAA